MANLIDAFSIWLYQQHIVITALITIMLCVLLLIAIIIVMSVAFNVCSTCKRIVHHYLAKISTKREELRSALNVGSYRSSTIEILLNRSLLDLMENKTWVKSTSGMLVSGDFKIDYTEPPLTLYYNGERLALTREEIRRTRKLIARESRRIKEEMALKRLERVAAVRARAIKSARQESLKNGKRKSCKD